MKKNLILILAVVILVSCTAFPATSMAAVKIFSGKSATQAPTAEPTETIQPSASPAVDESTKKESGPSLQSVMTSSMYSAYSALADDMGVILQYYIDKIRDGGAFPELWYKAFRAQCDLTADLKKSALYEDAIANGCTDISGNDDASLFYTIQILSIETAMALWDKSEASYESGKLSYRDLLDLAAQYAEFLLPKEAE